MIESPVPIECRHCGYKYEALNEKEERVCASCGKLP